MKLKVEYKNIDELIPYVNNARTHSENQVTQISASIKEFGFNDPIGLDGENGIIEGHGRLLAAKKLKMKEVPTIELSHLSDTQKKAYILAHNKLALNAGWDDDLLAAELEELKRLDLDFSVVGFEDVELSELLDGKNGAKEGLTDPDEVPEPPKVPITKLGDIWQLGNHRLMCGDSTSKEQVERLMGGQKADMVFTDPPYGVNIVGRNGKVGADNLAKNGIYAKVAGDDSTDIAAKAIELIAGLGASVVVIWGGNYYASHLPDSSCWLVWDKRGEMASNNFADCELAWTNQKTSVRKFSHTWSGMIKASEHGKKRVHPTQKPVALADWCLEQYGKECRIVLDLFGGSGFTLISCEGKNKQAYLMELSPEYCDVIIKRWEDFTGKKAKLIENINK